MTKRGWFCDVRVTLAIDLEEFLEIALYVIRIWGWKILYLFENSIKLKFYKSVLQTSQLAKYFKNILQYNFMSIWYYLSGFFSAHCIKETRLPRTHSLRFSYFFILCLRGCFLRFMFVISRAWCQWGRKLDSPCHSAPKVSFVEQCGGICFLKIIYFLFEYFFILQIALFGSWTCKGKYRDSYSSWDVVKESCFFSEGRVLY